MLIQEQPAQSKQMTLDEFLDWYPESQGRFELHDGAVIEIQASGTDEPKQPTLSVNQLVDGEYVVNQFRGDDVVRSLAFPDLNLTAEEIFQVGQ